MAMRKALNSFNFDCEIALGSVPPTWSLTGIQPLQVRCA